MTDKSKMAPTVQKELDKVQIQFDVFDNQVQEMTFDRMNQAQKQDV